MSERTDTTGDRAWERGWDGHAQAQLLRLARLSLPEKIAWLEQAQRVARHLSQSVSSIPSKTEPSR